MCAHGETPGDYYKRIIACRMDVVQTLSRDGTYVARWISLANTFSVVHTRHSVSTSFLPLSSVLLLHGGQISL